MFEALLSAFETPFSVVGALLSVSEVLLIKMFVFKNIENYVIRLR